MGKIKTDDIGGYWIAQSVICTECVNTQEENAATEEEIITQAEIDRGDEIYFCDRCHERLC